MDAILGLTLTEIFHIIIICQKLAGRESNGTVRTIQDVFGNPTGFV